jgi:hypothetical protein
MNGEQFGIDTRCACFRSIGSISLFQIADRSPYQSAAASNTDCG